MHKYIDITVHNLTIIVSFVKYLKQFQVECGVWLSTVGISLAYMETQRSLSLCVVRTPVLRMLSVQEVLTHFI